MWKNSPLVGNRILLVSPVRLLVITALAICGIVWSTEETIGTLLSSDIALRGLLKGGILAAILGPLFYLFLFVPLFVLVQENKRKDLAEKEVVERIRNAL